MPGYRWTLRSGRGLEYSAAIDESGAATPGACETKGYLYVSSLFGHELLSIENPFGEH